MTKKAKGKATMKEAGEALLTNPSATAGDALAAITGEAPTRAVAVAPKRAPARTGRAAPLAMPPAPRRHEAPTPAGFERYVVNSMRIGEDQWDALSDLAFDRVTTRATIVVDKSSIVRSILDRWIEAGCDISGLERLDRDTLRAAPERSIQTNFSLADRHWEALAQAARSLVARRYTARFNRSIVFRHVLDQGLLDLRMPELRRSGKR